MTEEDDFLTTGSSEEDSMSAEHRYETEVRECLADMAISPEERTRLSDLRREVGITPERAKAIFQRILDELRDEGGGEGGNPPDSKKGKDGVDTVAREGSSQSPQAQEFIEALLEMKRQLLQAQASPTRGGADVPNEAGRQRDPSDPPAAKAGQLQKAGKFSDAIPHREEAVAPRASTLVRRTRPSRYASRS